jgi:Porin-like glycoporin RafY
LKFNKITVACATLLATSAFALDFSANIEFDNTYRSGSVTNAATATAPAGPAFADKGLTQGGRVELNASGKAGANMFVAGKASFLAKKDGTAVTDDMWVQVGNATGDVKLGRFEAADLFPLPGDTLVNNAAAVYTANALRGRKDGNQFHAAGTVNLGGGLSAELGFVETKTVGQNKGVRPVISYANGPLTVRAGFEAGKSNLTAATATAAATTSKVSGFGATAAYDFGGFKLTGNVASGKEKTTLAGVTTTDKATTFGLIATVGAGNLGFINGKNDFANNAIDEKVTTFYASYALPLFDIKGATITPAFSTSKAKNVNGASGVSLKDNGVRVRINYTF